MSAINDENIDLVRLRQKVRDAMRERGFTEVIDNIYSAGDIVGNRLAVVAVQVRLSASDAEIELAAELAVENYRESVEEGPKP